MQTVVKIPACNHVRFVPENVQVLEQYNTIPFDKAWFIEQLQPWEEQVKYAYPMQKNDFLDIQIWTSTENIAKLKLYKCGSSTALDTRNFTIPTGMPVIIEDGIEYFVQRIMVPKFFDAYEGGTYYLQLEIQFDVVDDQKEFFISEPIYVKDKHSGTLLIDVGNTFNKDGVIFEQTRQRFRYRVHAAFTELMPKRDSTVFIDQGDNTVPLSSIAFRNWKFIIGGNGNLIPAYYVDKLNHAFSLDSIIIDGVQYTPIEGAGLAALDKDVNNPLYCVSIDLMEADNAKPFEFRNGGITLLEEIPPFPFVLYGVEFGYDNAPVFYSNAIARIGDQTQFDNYINAINAAIVSEGFHGSTVVDDGNSYVYNNGLGETYTAGKVYILKNRLGINCFANGVPIPIEIQIAGTQLLGSNYAPAYYAVVLPDNALFSWGPTNDVGTTIVNPSFTPSFGGTATYELWHDGRLGTIFLKGDSIQGIEKYSNINALPNQLQQFAISESDHLLAFDFFTMMSETRNTLKMFAATKNPNLTNVGNYYPSIAWSDHGWRVLNAIFLFENSLSTTVIDNWFNSMQTPMNVPGDGPGGFQFYVTGGIVSIGNQNPSAAPSAASAVARSVLINSWQWGLIY